VIYPGCYYPPQPPLRHRALRILRRDTPQHCPDVWGKRLGNCPAERNIQPQPNLCRPASTYPLLELKLKSPLAGGLF
jgi:hypothetical protein